jgi:predicted O-linked N-acetylglucosamine transferase (SPINDLY family)
VETLDLAAGRREHLEAYARVHVALDTTPYNGTTTTCEALWMGVPVVTTLGDRHAARVSASLLRAAGFPEWIAEDEAAFARVAADLASDRSRLTTLRASMRERLRASALLDGPAYARRVLAALESLRAGV